MGGPPNKKSIPSQFVDALLCWGCSMVGWARPNRALVVYFQLASVYRSVLCVHTIRYFIRFRFAKTFRQQYMRDTCVLSPMHVNNFRRSPRRRDGFRLPFPLVEKLLTYHLLGAALIKTSRKLSVVAICWGLLTL